ncbi:hypothetical protein QJS04_geneDACA014847 [Acorus gramineus]|uniref:Uncharacterized protein n=1 Tax=Acorus gramineus TaxID=55184 RepID=A0AAV9A363_ACOGR|nr:hypothetical protein QJS04_geneDACA014847 [Acorus gramineus]
MIDFTMGSLRSKIIVLFNFKPDADLTLTYIDEDGDVVTLMDDNDLHDAVILQRLNPLRITVQLNSNITAGNSDARLPTPTQRYGPPKTHYSVDEFLNSIFEEALKHAPEPVHAAISKVSGDLQSLVSKSALPAAEIVEHLLKSFHTGVHCDGCGVHPIMGYRYKSKVKEDYDLCSTCFSTMGNEADYFKIDKLKLESRFIQDVSVLDGTLMAPGSRFTKIWRMFNNGNVEWPSGTQLVWIGGDQFGDTGSVLLEISSNGFPIGGEIDVAVDFTAPSRPGRYTSYWRMAAPSGQKFGQRVWVLIQVDNRSDIMVNGFHGVPKLNLPPQNSGQKGKEIVDVNAEPMEHSPSPVPDLSHITMEIIKPLTVGLSGDRTMDPMQVDELMANLSGSGSPAAVSYPLIDLSVPDSETTPFAPPPPMTTTEDNSLEQILLKELEEMGFKQIDLNKEILRRNEYDLERSVDELCGIFEWDPLLVELEEMGFSDKEKNKEVLLKNGGSIKRAVMDLIAKEKGE